MLTMRVSILNSAPQNVGTADLLKTKIPVKDRDFSIIMWDEQVSCRPNCPNPSAILRILCPQMYGNVFNCFLMLVCNKGWPEFGVLGRFAGLKVD